jgi:3-oxoacyl-[acyl-carrier-protein] synthase II
MTIAIEDAGFTPDQVDYVNAHGTSTALNDAMETRAIRRALGAAADNVAVSSTKSMLGHLLGATGAVEIILTALAVQNDVAPPTINYQTPDPDCDLYYVPNEPKRMTIARAMSNTLGFGGHNASLLVCKPDLRD